jgi:hypothetical protein
MMVQVLVINLGYEGVVVVAERKVLARAEVEHVVSIGISDIVALALVDIDKVHHVGWVLELVHVSSVKEELLHVSVLDADS